MNIYLLLLLITIILRFIFDKNKNIILLKIIFISMIYFVLFRSNHIYTVLIGLIAINIYTYKLFNVYFYMFILFFNNFQIIFMKNAFIYEEKMMLILTSLILAFSYLYYQNQNDKNIGYLHKLHKKGKLLGLLSKISIDLQKTSDSEEIFNIMINALTDKYALAFDRVIIFKYEKNKNFFYPHRLIENNKENYKKFEEIKKIEIENSLENIFGNVFYNEKSILINGENFDFKDKFIFQNFKPKNFALLPLIEQKSVLGIVYIESIKKGEIAYDDLDIAMTIVYQSAMAINNAKLNTKNKIDARTDSLTKLFNKRYIDEKFDSLRVVWLEKKISISVLVIDIDFFKNYNDNNGHIMGNKALQKVANILVDQSRSRDIVIRFGGEEFCIFLLEANLELAKTIGERIRKKIEEAYFENEHMQPNKKLTISLGIAEYNGEDLDTFIDKGDIALYQSKKLGRNKVSVFRGDKDE